jgi:hypothetical protein
MVDRRIVASHEKGDLARRSIVPGQTNHEDAHDT